MGNEEKRIDPSTNLLRSDVSTAAASFCRMARRRRRLKMWRSTNQRTTAETRCLQLLLFQARPNSLMQCSKNLVIGENALAASSLSRSAGEGWGEGGRTKS
jgi:hypothetical protein